MYRQTLFAAHAFWRRHPRPIRWSLRVSPKKAQPARNVPTFPRSPRIAC